MTGSVIDFSSVPAAVRTPDTLAQVTLVPSSAALILQPVGLQGPPGISAKTLITVEFTAGAGGYTLAVPSAIGAWHAFFLDGMRQPPSAYATAGTSLIIPFGLTFSGAICVFDYLPA